MINKTLDLPFDEPQETYSTSEHLFHDQGIPPGTKGRIVDPAPVERKPREDRERGPRERRRPRPRPTATASRRERGDRSRTPHAAAGATPAVGRDRGARPPRPPTARPPTGDGGSGALPQPQPSPSRRSGVGPARRAAADVRRAAAPPPSSSAPAAASTSDVPALNAPAPVTAVSGGDDHRGAERGEVPQRDRVGAPSDGCSRATERRAELASVCTGCRR